ncbi:sugar ABC transporter permease [Prochlorococcus sp. MIT 1307]|uniref:carbohydrate ABC transporter permease n=1 Tax=Prochlorococcus sp. MIT 1307 TaxID=3096219 RepID=UPI002A750578|nr:sugar ABC transporter permease [Prochlorococcus sp. MIT 1307]
MNILLFLPAAILIIIVYCIPIFRYTWLSLHASSVMTGLKIIPNNGGNWNRIISDDRFWQDAFQTFRFASISVLFEILLAIAIALLLNQKFKGRGIVRALSLLPWALPTTVMALGWRWIFNTPYGPIEQIISLFNLEALNILSNPGVTWIATVIADVWKTTPFIALILLAGLQSIPYELYEAFRLEGGNKIQAFIKITLPLLKPYLVLSILFRMAQAFGVFDLIQVMTGGGPASSTESLGLYAYINAMRFLDFGYSATIIIFTFTLLLSFCLLSWLFIGQTKNIISSDR